MESHLLQMRGLKLIGKFRRCLAFGIVASFTDAWIETHAELLETAAIKSHLLQMRGLKQ